MKDRRSARVLITDLDDTVWHWFKMWHAAFSAELNELVAVTNIPASVLIPQYKLVHEKHHTSEYAYRLQELPSLVERFGPNFDPVEKLPTVVREFRRARKANISLYPTAFDTLVRIKSSGARVVAFTESQRYYSTMRMKTLGLDGLIDVMYATAESDQIPSEQIARSREYETEYYELSKTKTEILPLGLKKPNPVVLLNILKSLGCEKSDAVYLGDTLSKDVIMARDAGIFAIHAQYGETHRQPGYDLLKAVTHWPTTHVVAQAAATRVTVSPDLVLEFAYAQLLDSIKFETFPI